MLRLTRERRYNHNGSAAYTSHHSDVGFSCTMEYSYASLGPQNDVDYYLSLFPDPKIPDTGIDGSLVCGLTGDGRRSWSASGKDQ